MDTDTDTIVLNSSGISLLDEVNNDTSSRTISSTKTPSPTRCIINNTTPNTKNAICAMSRVDFGNQIIAYLQNKITTKNLSLIHI